MKRQNKNKNSHQISGFIKQKNEDDEKCARARASVWHYCVQHKMYTNIDAHRGYTYIWAQLLSFIWFAVVFVLFSLAHIYNVSVYIYAICSMTVLPVCAISISIAQAGKKQIAIPVDLKFRLVCQCDRNWRHFYIREDLNNGNYLHIYIYSKIRLYHSNSKDRFDFLCFCNKHTYYSM